MQSVEGYVSQPGSSSAPTTLADRRREVSAVATFYTMYKRTPCGQHLVSVCTNTLCAALGGDAIYRTLSRITSASGTRRPRASRGPSARSRWSTPSAWRRATTRPVLQVNYEYYDNQTPDSALDLVTALQAGESRTRPGAPR